MTALLGFQSKTFINQSNSPDAALCTRKYDISQDYDDIDTSTTCGNGDASRKPGYRSRTVNATLQYDRKLSLFNAGVRAFANRNPCKLIQYPSISFNNTAAVNGVGAMTTAEAYLFYGYIFSHKLSVEVKGPATWDIVWKSASSAKAAYQAAGLQEGGAVAPTTGILGPVLGFQSTIAIGRVGCHGETPTFITLCVKRWELETTFEEHDVTSTCGVTTDNDHTDTCGNLLIFPEVDRVLGLRTTTLTIDAFFDPVQNPFAAEPFLQTNARVQIQPTIAGEILGAGVSDVLKGYVFNTKVVADVAQPCSYQLTYKSSAD